MANMSSFPAMYMAVVTMQQYETTQLARLPLLLLDYAERQDLDRDELMRKAGLSGWQLESPDARISTRSMRNLWRAVIERLNDPILGLHVGASISAAQLGLVGYAMSYSQNLEEALNLLSRYARILSEAVQYELKRAGDTGVLIVSAHPSLVALRHPVEAGLVLISAIAREITQSGLLPLGIDLPSQMPKSANEYRSAFACPLHFNQPNAAITFSREQLRLPLKLADPTLGAYLDDLAAIQLDEIADQDSSLIGRVRQTVWKMLPDGRPDLWQTAAAMGISARTLQRRLREQGTSFSSVLDSLRRELSDEPLADRKLAVSEVAFLLGYSEPSAFQRAFRRWRGVSPARFRAG